MPEHRTMEELKGGLSHIENSPREAGRVEAIVVRPESNERLPVERRSFSPERGVDGDRWSKASWKTLADGAPHPDVQVTIMNARAIDLIAVARDRWELAGDNLFVDFDLSDANLSAGQRLSVGSVVLEISPEPHNGCRKFAERFGRAALEFVNSPRGKELHLRGVHARVIQAGDISVGDEITKLPRR